MKQINNSRIEELQQLKKEIRGSSSYLIVGIDVAKDKHVAFFGTAMGKTLFKKLVFDNDIKGFEKLIIQSNAVKAQHALGKTVFGLEPTANYHKPLGEFLVKNGHNVVLLSSNAVKKNRELLDGRWDKHDSKDSANIADLISQGKCLYYDHPSLEIRNLKSLLSLKRKLKKQEHSLRMRIRNHLVAQYFPEIDKHFKQGEDESLSIVKLYLKPSKITELEYEQFRRKVTKRKKGLAQEKRLKGIWQDANDSIGCEFGDVVEFEARVLVDSLRQIRESILKTDSHIKDICSGIQEYTYLLSIPGFGPVISAMTIGTIGNPFRFKSGKQVLKMVGLDLSASRSGKSSDNAIAYISKKGTSELRYALYQAALIASVKNQDFITYFTEKLRGREKEKGIKTKMRVKVAAKMLIIAWTLMKRKENFDPKYLTYKKG